jgi:prepilin-type N-terminal cleavage/methylation domain-containing protein
MHHRLTIKSSRAFTLIETLVAIAILMISVSGPLAIASKSLTAALYAKDQSTASFLAQEEMEIIKGLKDNYGGSTNWLNGTGSFDMAGCTSGAYCGLSISSGGYNFKSTPCPSTDLSRCKLYTDSNYVNNASYYVYSSGNPTIFTRYFYLSGVPSNFCNSGSTECQATVVVSWNEGTVPNAVTLSSEITNVAP